MCGHSKWVPAGVQHRRKRAKIMFFVICISANVQDIQCFCLPLFSLTNISETKKKQFCTTNYVKTVSAGATESNWQLLWFLFYGYSFLLWLVFPFMVFPYKVKCKRQHMLQLFRHCCFCIATLKLLQSIRLSGIFLLKYCSAGVTDLYSLLIHYPTIPYLNILPKYTLSQYINELYPILIQYRPIPYSNT